MDSKGKGAEGERAARDYLQKQGWLLLHSNYHTRFGELDLVMKANDILVFVEVKARRRHEDMDTALGRKKAERLYRAAEIYIQREEPLFKETRFDAVYIKLSNRGEAEEIGHRPNFF